MFTDFFIDYTTVNKFAHFSRTSERVISSHVHLWTGASKLWIRGRQGAEPFHDKTYTIYIHIYVISISFIIMVQAIPSPNLGHFPFSSLETSAPSAPGQWLLLADLTVVSARRACILPACHRAVQPRTRPTVQRLENSNGCVQKTSKKKMTEIICH